MLGQRTEASFSCMALQFHDILDNRIQSRLRFANASQVMLPDAIVAEEGVHAIFRLRFSVCRKRSCGAGSSRLSLTEFVHDLLREKADQIGIDG